MFNNSVEINVENQFNTLKRELENENKSNYPNSIILINNLYRHISHCNNASDYMQRLIDMSFVINKYPRRLIKKGTSSQPGTQFEMSFSSLLDESIHINVSDVKSYLLNSSQDGMLQPTEIGAKFESNGHNHWSIKNMRFKTSERGRASRNTISEKSIIKFVVSIRIEEAFFSNSWTKDLYSDTVIVIVHSSQEADAQLTLFIDDYYRDDRLSFIEGRGFPYRVYTNAEELVSFIADYFVKETGRGLTAGNYDYLFQKIANFFSSNDIAISDFIKKPLLSGTKLSFGLWIISLIRLCKNDHINKLWVNDIIEGFVPKDVGDLLVEPGTFLLRFSERQAAIGVVMRSATNAIDPWAPFTEAECRKLHLANHLVDFPTLKMLRKSDGNIVPKNIALDGFINRKDVDDGYTIRGGFIVLQNPDEECLSVETHRVDDMDIDNDDMDINMISEICDQILATERLE